MPIRFFIGGTGRSGTGILYRTLGQHPEIAAMPAEMRFIVDPDGLRGLASAFHNNYSPVDAAEAFYRFERLMRVHLANPSSAPFLSYDFPNWFGDTEYWNRLDQFCSEFFAFEYSAIVERQPLLSGSLDRLKGLWLRAVSSEPVGKPKDNSRLTYNWPRTDRRVYRYFSDRSTITRLMSEFVDDLFLSLTVKMNKKTWCEKTPQNLLFVEFIWELFPDSMFIHMLRDPRGVAFSLMNQAWGPNDAAGASAYLKGIYDRWFDIDTRLEKTKHLFWQIKLEDFATDPQVILDKVQFASGLQTEFDDIQEISLSKVNNWQDSLPEHDLRTLNRSLGEYIERLGYKV